MYTDHFGMTDRPFQLTPDARYYYESRTHKKAMAYLGYGLAQGEGFIIITGEIGAGKSTLVAHLMATIDKARLNIVSLVSSQVEGDDMLRLIAQRFGLSTAGVSKAQLLDFIEMRFQDEARKGKRTLLIIDEAQNLGVSALEELRMLSNFTLAGRSLVQIFLLGQPEFRDALKKEGVEQLRQRVIATHHLEPMEEEELQGYVLHRLEVAGWRGQPLFDPSAFPAIYQHTGGVPRKINQLANRILLFASIERAQIIDATLVEAVIADLASETQAQAQIQTQKQDHVQDNRVQPLRPVEVKPQDPSRKKANGHAKPDAAPEPEKAADWLKVAEPAPDSTREMELERRVEELEARLREQDAAIRRILTLLVDWVENDRGSTSYRHNAA